MKAVGAGDADPASRYTELFRETSMSVGVYVLRAGDVDPQSPHRQDEAYVVMRGRARLRVGDTVTGVGPGSVVFVPAGVEHRFVDIDEDLHVVVIFAPPEE